MGMTLFAVLAVYLIGWMVWKLVQKHQTPRRGYEPAIRTYMEPSPDYGSEAPKPDPVGWLDEDGQITHREYWQPDWEHQPRK